eukprot:1612574-Pleurochrysis_carterae.AAC.1
MEARPGQRSSSRSRIGEGGAHTKRHLASYESCRRLRAGRCRWNRQGIQGGPGTPRRHHCDVTVPRKGGAGIERGLHAGSWENGAQLLTHCGR